MKTIKFLAVATLLAVSASASAQFTNTGAKSSSSSSSTATDGWSTMWVEYNPSTMKFDYDDADDESFTGLSVGYSKAVRLAQSSPVFLEVGVGLQYSFKDKEMAEELELEDYSEYMDPKVKMTMFSAKIPVNLMYAFSVPNSSVTIMPFVGANLRFNISGKQKLEWNFSDDFKEYLLDEYGSLKDCEIYGIPANGYDYDVFDKKDMGSSDATWKRFQMGWNIGVKARFGEQFLVGLSYGNDFSELAKKTKISTVTIALGYTF